MARLLGRVLGRRGSRRASGDTSEIGSRGRGSLSPAVRRVLLHLSAAFAAVVCAALLVNYVIMPIIVRRGDLTVTPGLVGVPVVEAERMAEAAGVRIRVDVERPDSEVPVGSVAFQTPQAGTQIKRGRTVGLVVSSGADMRRLPMLAGLNARQAQLDAEHAGFAIEDVVEVHTNHIERGRVIGTDPGDGAVRPLGSGVRMLVSLGPRPVEFMMPSLVGKTAEEARLVVEALGLVTRSVRYERGRRRSAREVVVVQDPVAGSHVVEGEGVTLRIGN
ncbi:MAG: PASTA domain-containing protein [Candidatus Eisenbacteria sp.]|nr:PASTA domain-containing protein [Candidatus Eisenbacteria bacterium]